jgi:hypothetical protein
MTFYRFIDNCMVENSKYKCKKLFNLSSGVKGNHSSKTATIKGVILVAFNVAFTRADCPTDSPAGSRRHVRTSHDMVI